MSNGSSSNAKVCSILSVVFGAVAFLFCPPFFGLAGLILGIIGTVNSPPDDRGLGTVGIILSIVGTVVGMALGMAVFAGMANTY